MNLRASLVLVAAWLAVVCGPVHAVEAVQGDADLLLRGALCQVRLDLSRGYGPAADVRLPG